MRRGATSELWKHIRAYRKESSHGDEKALRRRDAESDSPIINNKSSVISGGIISPGTARNKTGERVSVFFFFSQRSFSSSHLQKAAPAFNAAAAIYPSVTAISAELAPVYFQSSRKRRSLRPNTPPNPSPFPLDTRTRRATQVSGGGGTPSPVYFSGAVKKPPCRINAQFLQVNRALGLLGGRGGRSGILTSASKKQTQNK